LWIGAAGGIERDFRIEPGSLPPAAPIMRGAENARKTPIIRRADKRINAEKEGREAAKVFSSK
jgi:hypothetical protein